MRSKRTRMFDVRTKIHIFSGGIKEDVAQVELRGGELIDCQNYEEIDGLYHGYSSIPGYEVMDGTVLASAVPTVTLTDYGIDKKTALLLETKDNPIVDSSDTGHTVVNNGVTFYSDPNNFASSYSKFFSTSFVFDGSGTFEIADHADFNLGTRDYTVDLLFRLDDTAGSQTIIEKEHSYRLSSEEGVLNFMVSTDGIDYTDFLIQTGTLLANTRYHVEITRRSGVFRMFINGIKDTATITVPTVATNVNPVIIGASFTGQMSEIRFSKDIYRHYKDFEIPIVPYSTRGYYTYQIDDVAREARRLEIDPVPGDGSVLGVAVHDGVVYAVRNEADGLASKVYKTTATGWSAMTNTIKPNGTYCLCSCRFDELAGLQRQKVLFLTSSVDYPMYINGTTLTDITSPYLPDNPTSGYCAISVIGFKNRLFLAYPDGRLIFSAVGNPLEFDPVSGAGEMYLEDDITNMVIAPGDALVIYCRNSTHILKALTDMDNASSAVTATYKFRNESFSNQSGAIANTAKRILGTVVSMSDRGLTNIETTNAFGDFTVGYLSKNVQKTLFKYRDLLTTTVVHRKNNQYRMFFSNNLGLIFTFDIEKKVKGVTKIKYNVPVLHVAEGDDASENLMIVFGSEDGYVYKMDSGTSFNGQDIETKIATSYNSYSSPTLRKRFRNVSLELKADRDMAIQGKLIFDYGDPGMPRTSTEEMISEGEGGIWGTDIWGAFTYGSAVTQNPILYASGYGKNMSILISTKDKYRNPHVLNAAIVEYSIVGPVM